MQDKIVPQQFMLLKREVREHLAKIFNIKKSGITEIMDQEVIKDGRTIEDLSVITTEKMAEYVGSVESFGRLWELTAAKAWAELNPPVGVIGESEVEVDKPVDSVDKVTETKHEGKKNK